MTRVPWLGRAAAACAAVVALACGVAAQRESLDRYRELTAALTALDELDSAVARLRTQGLDAHADAIAATRPRLAKSIAAFRDRLGPPRLSFMTIANLFTHLHGVQANPKRRSAEIAGLINESRKAMRSLTNRRDGYAEGCSLDDRIEEVGRGLRAARINKSDRVESIEASMAKLRRMQSELSNRWLEQLMIEVSPGLERYYRRSIAEESVARERIEQALSRCHEAVENTRGPLPDYKSIGEFAKSILELRDLVVYAPIDDRPAEADRLIGMLFGVANAETPPTLELRYRVPSSSDRDRDIAVFTRRLVALGVDVDRASITRTPPSDVVVSLPAFESESPQVKRVLGQRGSILLAWEATDEELRPLGPDFDAGRFAAEHVAATGPIPLFANPDDPRRPTTPNEDPAFHFYPPQRSDGPRATGPTRGCIVAVEPDATFTEADIATLEPAQAGFEEVLSFEMTRDQRVRLQRVTGERKGRNLCVVVNDRLVSRPTVESALPGSGLIRGIDSRDLVRALVAAHPAGALDATPELVSERVIDVAEAIDFSLPPRVGTKLRIERKLVERGKSPMGEELRATHAETVVHEVLAVEGGRVVRASRTFRTATVQPGRGKRPDTDALPTPLQHTCVIITWDGDGPKHAVVQSAGAEHPIEESRRWAKSRVAPAEVRQPLLPLGDGVRAVGEKWSLDAAAVLSALHGGHLRLTKDASATATARLVSIEDTAHGRIARIEVTARLTSEAGAIEWTADVRYDEKHRIVIRCVARGRGTPRDDHALFFGRENFERTATAKVISRPL